MKRNLIFKVIINTLLIIIFSLLFYINTNNETEIPTTINMIGNSNFIKDEENTISVVELTTNVGLILLFIIIIYIMNIFINNFLYEGNFFLKNIKGKIIKWLIILFIVYLIYGIISWLFMAMPCACL